MARARRFSSALVRAQLADAVKAGDDGPTCTRSMALDLSRLHLSKQFPNRLDRSSVECEFRLGSDQCGHAPLVFLHAQRAGYRVIIRQA